MRIRVLLIASLVVPAVGAAAACGSSQNNNSKLGAGDSGADVSVVQEAGTPDVSAGDAVAEASDDDGGILGANCPAFDAGTPFVEATHAPLPTVAYWGGPILTAPQVITFTFPTTPNTPGIQSFGQTIAQTPWFSQVTKDYCIPDGGACIQAGPTGVSVPMTTAAATTYVDTFGFGSATGGTDLEAFINQQIAAAVAADTIPAPGANSLYVFYFPPSSTIWMGPVNQGAESCQAFGGYHNGMTYTDGTTPIVYAIIPDCSSGNLGYDFENVTIAASHEIVEATTDPQPESNVSWYLDVSPGGDAGTTTNEFRNDPWTTAVSFGEVADNCESIPVDTWELDGGDLVQRIWSPTAAAVGHNPCIPVPAGESYYNASTDKAIYVASVGDTFTVDVSAFSDMPRVSWRLDAVDQTPTQTVVDSSGNPAYLKMEFVNGVTGSDGVNSLLCVNNGTTGQLKVTLLADPDTDSSLQQADEWPEADGVIYSADVANAVSIPVGDGGTYVEFPYQFWPFAVITPTTAASLGITSSGVADIRQVAALRAARLRHRADRNVTLPVKPAPFMIHP